MEKSLIKNIPISLYLPFNVLIAVALFVDFSDYVSTTLVKLKRAENERFD